MIFCQSFAFYELPRWMADGLLFNSDQHRVKNQGNYYMIYNDINNSLNAKNVSVYLYIVFNLNKILALS